MSTDQAESDLLTTEVAPPREGGIEGAERSHQQLEEEGQRAGLFWEPLTARTPVKITYGGKRKYKRTPTKSYRNASQSTSMSLSLVESSLKRHQATHVRGGGHKRGGRGQRLSRTSSTSHISSNENDSAVRSDLEAYDESKCAMDTPRGSTTATGSAPMYNNPPPTRNAKKRPLSRTPSSSSAASSPLTIMSSPEVEVHPKPLPQLPPTITLAPRLARQFLRVQSQLQPAMIPEHEPHSLKQSKSLDDIFALDSEESESEDEMDSAEVGSLVWVSINPEGHLADVALKKDTLWWPAKVVLPKPLMRVTLFGDPPGPRQLDVPRPSASNVRSVELDGHIRFQENDYRLSRRKDKSVQSSPRKKRKLHVDIAWQQARDAMMTVHKGDNDDMLPGSSRYVPATLRRASDTKVKGSVNAGQKGKIKASNPDIDTGIFDMELKQYKLWRAPSPNPLLEIPGELILARESRTKKQYWPAKILSYVRPTRPLQKPKYKVVFFDSVVKQIEPDLFYLTTDDEFATCNMGESTGNYGLDVDNDALEDIVAAAEDFTRPFAPEDETTLRAPSPLPSLPAPGPVEFETELSIPEQFQYVKPVLAAVLDDVYGPAKARTEGFMRGGGARKKVLDAVPPRGSLTAMEKEEVAFLVRSWTWRREKRREMGLGVGYPHERLYPPPVWKEHASSKSAGADREDDDNDVDSVLTPTSELSYDGAELLPPSEAEAPPSSFPLTDNGMDMQDEKVMSGPGREDVPGHEPAPPNPGSYNNTAMIVRTTVVHRSSTEGSSSTQIQHASPATIVPVPEDGQEVDDKRAAPVDNDSIGAARPPSPILPAARRTFHDLDAVEKLTYCNNILLQEAILQLLLWRTGQRRILGLLEPHEEEHLHARATEEGHKTNWVHDILRMRQAVEKTMLPSAKSSSRGGGNAALGTTRTGRIRRRA